MKRLSLVLSLVCFAVAFAMAQRTIVGTVLDDSGETLIGASVQAKGTNAGTVTDVNGKFSLAVPREANTLIVSYTGYTTQEIALGASNVVDIRLAAGKILTEVVVSATGLTRNKSEVVYANQTVNSEDLNAVTNKSVLNALQGKTAGVKISAASGQAGASTRIVLRGETSLTQGNNALIVVDGVPMNNSSASGGGGTADRSQNKAGDRDNYVDFGNRGNDINPDDIESVTVLKGPAATTLYGSRGGSGVVLITTKKGKKGDKANISVSSSISSDKAYLIYKQQEKWGSGYASCGGCGGGTNIFMGENFAWGAAFDGQLIPWTAQPVDEHGVLIPLSNGKIEQLVRPYSAVKNNFQNFFDIGTTFRNNVSIGGGNDKMTYFLSYTNFNNKGIMPHTFFNKHNVLLNVGAQFSPKLRSDFSLGYTKLDQRGATEGGYPFGYSTGTPAMAFATQTPSNIPFSELRDYNSPYHDFKGFYAMYSINPYFIFDKQDVRNSVDNIISSASLKYSINPYLSVTGKVSTDFITSIVTEKAPKFNYERALTWSDGDLIDGGRAGGTFSLGSYKESADRFINMTYDVFTQYSRQLNDDFKLNTLVGFNSIDQTQRNVKGTTVGGLVVPEFYDLTNSTEAALATIFSSQYRLFGAYLNNSIGYKDFLFLEYSARKDYSSTLPKGNRGFFYQAGGLSFVPTRLPNFGMEQISNLKFRAGLGSAGKDAPTYRLDTYYNLNPTLLDAGDDYQIRFPFAGVPGAEKSGRIGNAKLKPELSVTSEVGLDIGFLQDRIEFEYTYYDINSKNQIVDVNIPWSSGFTLLPVNIGRMVNRGHEVVLRLTPVRNSWLKWNVFGTFSQNRNTVKTILENAPATDPTAPVEPDELVIFNGLVHFTGHGSMNLVAAEGQPFGTYKGTNYVKDAQGRIVVDGNGNPQKSAQLEYLGSYQPDWMGSLGTSFSVKGFSVSALLDGKKGGKFFSGTKVSTEFNGTASTTDIGNRESFIVENSINADGSPNTTMTQAYAYYKAAPAASYLVDASYLKLRELTLAYTLPKATIGGFSKITIGLFGKNLKFWLPSENTFADPEVGGVGGSSDAAGIESTTTPPAKSFGAEIKLNF